jgi:hypothetical protein
VNNLIFLNLESNMVQDNQENFTNCGCEPCPSYNVCMRGGHQKLYCAKDKSSCEVPMSGCLCGNCPVHLANNLTSGYYCLGGKAE